MNDDRLNMGTLGLEPGDFDPARDQIHIVFPLRVMAETEKQGKDIASSVTNRIDAAIAEERAVQWVTDRSEAAYVMIANSVIALNQLSRPQRARVLAMSPALADLIELTELWVIELSYGALAVVPGPGSYPMSRGNMQARRATVDEIRSLGSQS